jgi:Arc/MetJ family transcription regulator
LCIVARTNIDIDGELIARVMARYRLSTKRDAVDFALRRLVGNPMTREEALAMEGKGWHGDDALIWGTQEVATDLVAPDRAQSG